MSVGDPQNVHEAWILPYKPNAPYKFPRGDKNRGLVPRECLDQDPVSSDNIMQTGGLGRAGTGIRGPLLSNLGYCVQTMEDLSAFFKSRNPSKGQLRIIRDIARKEAVRQAKRLRAAAHKEMRNRYRMNVFKNLIKFLTDESEIAIYFDKAFKRQRATIYGAVNQINVGYVVESSRNILDDETTEKLMEVIRKKRYELKTQIEGEFPNRYMCVYKVELKSMYLITRFKLNNEDYDFIIKDVVYERRFRFNKKLKMYRHLQRVGRDKQYEILQESGQWVCRIFVNKNRDDTTAKNKNGSLLKAVETVTNLSSTENNQTKNQVVVINDSDDEDDVCYMSDESSNDIIEIDDSDAEIENSTKAIKMEEVVVKIDKKSALRTSNNKEEPMKNELIDLDIFKTVKIKSEKNTTQQEITKVNKNPTLATNSIKTEKLIEQMGTKEPENERTLNYKLKTDIKSDKSIKMKDDNITVDTAKTAVRVCNIKAEKASDVDSTAKLTKEGSSKVNLNIESENNINTDEEMKEVNEKSATIACNVKTKKSIEMNTTDSENRNKSPIDKMFKTIKTETENPATDYYQETIYKTEDIIENKIFRAPRDESEEKYCKKRDLRNNLNVCFSDFLRGGAYREFKFLGRFEENEFEVLSEFLEDFFLVKFGNSPLDKDFERIWNDAGCDLDYKMDINGGILIYKVS